MTAPGRRGRRSWGLNEAILTREASNPNSLDIVGAHLFLPPIIKLRRARAGMVGHQRGLLKRPAVLQIRGDARRPKRVVADLAP